MRIFNFSSGPSVMPLPVLEKAREEILSVRSSGMSVMEISHRSQLFAEILDDAVSRLRRLIGAAANYRILFLHGGATAQFTQIPQNLLAPGSVGEYVVTGYWGKKAVAEAKRIGTANVAATTEADGFTTIPAQADIRAASDAAYLHYTSNETIGGVEFPFELTSVGPPVICDASSNILSKPFKIENFGIIYAGAQKNIGPSGVTVMIIRDDLLDRVNTGLPAIYDYREIAKNNSLLNTPNTWAIYMVGLVCEWLEEQGGTAAMEARNAAKAGLIYDAIDGSGGFYRGKAAKSARSRMNVTFELPTVELEKEFCAEAAANGMDGLAGHRSVGGVRASIYNAFPVEGVESLVSFMRDFAAKYG